MLITDGEFALARRNAMNVQAANQSIDVLAADVARLRQKLAEAYGALGVERAHTAALTAQVNMCIEQLPEGRGVRANTGRAWADGKPLTKLGAEYIRVFDGKIQEFEMGDPTLLRDKLAGE